MLMPDFKGVVGWIFFPLNSTEDILLAVSTPRRSELDPYSYIPSTPEHNKISNDRRRESAHLSLDRGEGNRREGGEDDRVLVGVGFGFKGMLRGREASRSRGLNGLSQDDVARS